MCLFPIRISFYEKVLVNLAKGYFKTVFLITSTNKRNVLRKSYSLYCCKLFVYFEVQVLPKCISIFFQIQIFLCDSAGELYSQHNNAIKVIIIDMILLLFLLQQPLITWNVIKGIWLVSFQKRQKAIFQNVLFQDHKNLSAFGCISSISNILISFEPKLLFCVYWKHEAKFIV